MSASQAVKFILVTACSSPFAPFLHDPPSFLLTHCFRYREVSNLEGVGPPKAISVKDEEEEEKGRERERERERQKQHN